MTKKVEQSDSPRWSTGEAGIRLRRKKAKKIISELKKLFPKTKIALNYSNPIELFVAVVLSAQTTDRQVNIVTADLFKKYQTIDDYTKTPLTEFEHDIKRIGLYKGKAKNIKTALEIVNKEYDGTLPDSMEKLINLPGVGRKTANVLLGNIYGKSEGIAVDTHVKRLSKLFGLTAQTDPNKIERDLMEIVPRKDWFIITYLLIDYGRKYCTARCKHEDCPLREFIS
ncbi:MAG: endonuclease III [Candidatus Levybacteria bacterium]|nr:endonuclease III [Candidatus Levybacteria bacterium]